MPAPCRRTDEVRGFGSLDELFEALTLIETGKIRHFSVVLVEREHWAGLLEEGKVSTDVEVLRVADDPDEILALVERGHHRRHRGTGRPG